MYSGWICHPCWIRAEGLWIFTLQAHTWKDQAIAFAHLSVSQFVWFRPKQFNPLHFKHFSFNIGIIHHFDTVKNLVSACVCKYMKSWVGPGNMATHSLVMRSSCFLCESLVLWDCAFPWKFTWRASTLDRWVKPHSKMMTARRGCDRLVTRNSVGNYKNGLGICMLAI